MRLDPVHELRMYVDERAKVFGVGELDEPDRGLVERFGKAFSAADSSTLEDALSEAVQADASERCRTFGMTGIERDGEFAAAASQLRTAVSGGVVPQVELLMELLGANRASDRMMGLLVAEPTPQLRI